MPDFFASKSQRRVLRKNADLNTSVGPINLTPEIKDLFERHKLRFKSGVPTSIYDFLSRDPAIVPTIGYEVTVRVNGRLAAASFFDVGRSAISSIYGIFDPEMPDRSLGIYTMLKELEFAAAAGKAFYYHGYAYEGTSYYDYKKRFAALEVYDWMGNWTPFPTDR